MSELIQDRLGPESLPGELIYSDPEDVGLDARKLRRAASVVESVLRPGPIRSASLSVVRGGRIVFARTWDEPVSRPYLVASLTKPITALAALILLEEGKLFLDARISDFLPEFGRGGKDGIRVRHLLAHTSGLPDMLPQNLELRAAHAPLAEYYTRLLDIEPLFLPDTQVCYQSMGFLVLDRLVEALCGQPLPQFLSDRVFLPLGLRRTFLGGNQENKDASDLGVPVQLPEDQVGKDWNWNSPYWRSLGAPWGGLLATSLDLAALIYAIGHVSGRFLAPPTRAAMLSNQTDGLAYFDGSPTFGATDSTTSDFSGVGAAPPWGLGWRLNGGSARYSELFGDLASPRAFGHTGATGTAFWYDPEHDVALCLLTTWPKAIRNRVAARVSNAVLGAVTSVSPPTNKEARVR